jgi:Ca2+ transporting ATPase
MLNERNNIVALNIQGNNTNESNTFDITNDTILMLFRENEERNPDNDLKLIEKLGKVQGIASKLKIDPRMGIKANAADREQRIAAFGNNKEEIVPLPHYCRYVLNALGDHMLRILIMATIFELFIYTEDGIVYFFIVLTLLFYISSKNYSRAKRFKQVSEDRLDKHIHVLRDGQNTTVGAAYLLVGDIILIKTGDILPADGMLISGSAIQIDESLMTGKNELIDIEPYERCIEIYINVQAETPGKVVTGKHAIPSPLVFSGTEVKQGNGVYMALAIGRNSISGQMKESVKQFPKQPKTVIQNRLHVFAWNILKFGLIAAIFSLIIFFIVFGITFLKQLKAYHESVRNAPGNDMSIFDPHISIVANCFYLILQSISIVIYIFPIGLPLAVAFSLAFFPKKLDEEKFLVRNLYVPETMGNVNYICTDKTGTLTDNLMTVFKIFDCSKDEMDFKKISGAMSGSNIKGCITSRNPQDNFKSMEYYNTLILTLALTIVVEIHEQDSAIKYSKTDLAFVNFLNYFNERTSEIRQKYYPANKNELKMLVFTSQRKRMSIAIQNREFKTGYRMFIKGAPEYILQSISHYLNPSTCSETRNDDNILKLFNDKIHEYASEGLRTFGVAYKDLTKEEFDNFNKYEKDKNGVSVLETSGYVLIGIIGLEDTLKPGVPEAINDIHKAGITVIMATGDNKETAISIAKQTNILPQTYKSSKSGEQLDNISLAGEEFYNAVGGLACKNCLDKLNKSNGGLPASVTQGSDVICDCPRNVIEAKKRGKKDTEIRNETVFNIVEFSKIIKTLRVVARSRPLDKYLLVLGLKEQQNIVAAIGDGINDALALNKAHVGFAMNDGNDVAKKASDIIILDNKFASIVTAVLWGRNMFDSIRKFISLRLTISIYAWLLLFVTTCAMDITPTIDIQMLWINLLISYLGSVALALEKPDRKLLNRKPYPISKSFISWRMWKHILGQVVVLLGIELLLYFYAPQFISEDNIYRINETGRIYNCFGQLPGGRDDIYRFYDLILDGRRSSWSPDIIQLSPTYDDCRSTVYSSAASLSTAFDIYEYYHGSTPHITIMLNVFVLYTIFNQLCIRLLKDEMNILGLTRNLWYLLILLFEIVFDILFIQFGSFAFYTPVDGLTLYQWMVCLGFAVICFPVHFILNFIPIEKCLKQLCNCIRCRSKASGGNLNNPVNQVRRIDFVNPNYRDNRENNNFNTYENSTDREFNIQQTRTVNVVTSRK